ncbi:MAG TPA: hypothetical protein VFV75_12690 [Candidatus Polarisedimenticolaceae bacterium]|nr:hypothetical protein [Candidatus Polarisedimenticolaceae bacterium]
MTSPLLLVLSSLLGAPAEALPPPPDPAATLKQVAADVERIRGLKFKKQVPMEVVGDEATRKHALQRLEDLQAKDALDHELEVYRVLKMVPEGDVMESVLGALEEQVGGFYDPSKKTFFLLDDMPSGMQPALIAHELTHALEDQHYDLDARLRASTKDEDLSFAVSAVHEGSATLVMTMYAAEALNAGKMKQDDFTTFAQTEAGRGDKLAALPPVLYRQLIGTYVLGTNFITRGKGPYGDKFPVGDLKRLYKDGPTSSEQILHPERYWQWRDRPQQVDLGTAGKLLGEGWTRTANGVFGEMTIAVLAGASTPNSFATAWAVGSSGWTNAAATGWGGDHWELWKRGEERAVLLGTLWDNAKEAQEFEAALGAGPTFAFRRKGRALAVVAGIPAGNADPILDALLQAALKKKD